MNKIIRSLFLLSSIFSFSQQENKVEDLFGVKVGLIEFGLNYEKALSDKITLNNKITYAGGFFSGSSADRDLDYVFSTILSVEPRYYYNLEKRGEKGKNTANNSGNYIATELYYLPDLFSATNSKNLSINKSFGIIPKYGLRRSIAKNINFEFAFGIGYAWVIHGDNRIVPDLDLNINWNF